MSRRPPSRMFLGAALVLLAGAAFARCQPADEEFAGLVVAAAGALAITNENGELIAVDGAPGDGAIRRVTSARDCIVAQAADGSLVVSDPPGENGTRVWRTLRYDAPSIQASTGMDLSPDGRTLAVVLGNPDTPGLELVRIDVESGAASRQSIDLMANGPPAWLGPTVVALEVIRPDEQAGIATVDPSRGEAAISAAVGIEASATRDGTRLAVADAVAGLVIRDTADWLAGVPDNAVGLVGPEGATLFDLALDADGTRLAVVYGAASGGSSTIEILRRAGAGWEEVTSIKVDGDAPVGVDWLD